MQLNHRSMAIGLAAVAISGTSLSIGCGSSSDETRSDEARSDESRKVSQRPVVNADGSRPATVPADYVVTPSGYFHPSCIVEVSADERLGEGGIERKDGSIHPVEKCAFPRFDRQGRRAPIAAPNRPLGEDEGDERDGGGAEEPFELNHWQMYTEKQGLPPLGFISTRWTVPDLPLIERGVVFYFPGLMAQTTGATILQPVLGSQQGQWSIASWNCCLNDVPLHSPHINVSPGDVIYGSVTGTECDARTGVCAKWDILTRDETTGQSTTLHTTSYGLPMNWAFSGVLEVWDINHCAGLVPNGEARFTDVQVRDIHGQPITPAWEAKIFSERFCGYDVQADSTSATLRNTPVLQPKPPRPQQCGRIEAGEGLTMDSIHSCDRFHSLTMRLNGELTFDRGGAWGGSARLWTSHATTPEAFIAMMQPDGNFVIKDMAAATVWSTGTGGHPGAYLSINEEAMTIYDANDVPIWSADTSGR